MILAFSEPWQSTTWRKAFCGVFVSVEDAMLHPDADAIVIVEADGLRLVRQRLNGGDWAERDELITGFDSEA